MRPREGFAESGWICFYIAFSHSCDKCWTEINLREEGFVLVQKFGIVHLSREGMGQECEEAGHITSTVRKLRGAEMLVFTHSLSLFCLVWDPQLTEWCYPYSGQVFPLQLNLSGKALTVIGLSPRSNWYPNTSLSLQSSWQSKSTIIAFLLSYLSKWEIEILDGKLFSRTQENLG